MRSDEHDRQHLARQIFYTDFLPYLRYDQGREAYLASPLALAGGDFRAFLFDSLRFCPCERRTRTEKPAEEVAACYPCTLGGATALALFAVEAPKEKFEFWKNKPRIHLDPDQGLTCPGSLWDALAPRKDALSARLLPTGR